MRKAISLALLFMAATAAIAAIAAQTRPSAVAAADAAPNFQALLRVPAADYRRDWILLGSFSVLADDPEQGAKQLHVVYAEPKSVDVYRETGAFPDGTVLVKDVYATKTEALTTGTASYADRLVGRFVMVKDRSDSYAGRPALWGDGWGWAFFDGTETRKTVTTDYRDDCLACHEPVRGQDLIYVQGYPVLSR